MNKEQIAEQIASGVLSGKPKLRSLKIAALRALEHQEKRIADYESVCEERRQDALEMKAADRAIRMYGSDCV